MMTIIAPAMLAIVNGVSIRQMNEASCVEGETELFGECYSAEALCKIEDSLWDDVAKTCTSRCHWSQYFD